MIKLEISGGNIQEFYGNAMNALGLLASGGAMQQQVAAAQQKAGEAQQPDTSTTEAVGDPTKIPPAEKPPRRTRAKPPETIEATANKPAALTTETPAEVVDDDPLGLGLTETKSADAAEPTYTLDDMRKRVTDILAAHGPKTDKNPNARGNAMPDSIAYVRKLFAPFGVKLAAEIPPEKFGEFMAASQPYLDGTAT